MTVKNINVSSQRLPLGGMELLFCHLRNWSSDETQVKHQFMSSLDQSKTIFFLVQVGMQRHPSKGVCEWLFWTPTPVTFLKSEHKKNLATVNVPTPSKGMSKW